MKNPEPGAGLFHRRGQQDSPTPSPPLWFGSVEATEAPLPESQMLRGSCPRAQLHLCRSDTLSGPLCQGLCAQKILSLPLLIPSSSIHHRVTGHIDPCCRGSQATMAPACDTAGRVWLVRQAGALPGHLWHWCRRVAPRCSQQLFIKTRQARDCQKTFLSYSGVCLETAVYLLFYLSFGWCKWSTRRRISLSNRSSCFMI